jgi:nucleoside-diphosphate-sugar epimerase
MMKKCLDISKIAEFGWKPKISLDQGISLILKGLDN